MTKVRDIAEAIEGFAPLCLQEGFDNSGLQVGNPEADVKAVLLCLDVTEEILAEARERKCGMIISHHPLIFRGLKNLTGADSVQRIVLGCLKAGIAVYSAHTSLDSATGGVSCEMASMLGLKNINVLEPSPSGCEGTGLGVVGDIEPTPKLEFLRVVKEKFGVGALRYAVQWPGLVVRRVALCGGAGASLIGKAVDAGADTFITGDLKYHAFTEYGDRLLLADIGHYESELCTERLLARILRERCPDVVVYFPEEEKSPVGIL